MAGKGLHTRRYGLQDIICNIGSSNSTHFVGKAPCLTASSCTSFRYYSTARRRDLNCNDYLTLQGMSPSQFPGWGQIVSRKDFAHMLGNASHALVLKRIFVQIAMGTRLALLLSRVSWMRDDISPDFEHSGCCAAGEENVRAQEFRIHVCCVSNLCLCILSWIMSACSHTSLK